MYMYVYTCDPAFTSPLNRTDGHEPTTIVPQHQDRQEYEAVKKKLERIERERTRLACIDRAGTYNALISCPICLEVNECALPRLCDNQPDP